MLSDIKLPDDLFPVQAFFNAIPERSFVAVLEEFSRGIGAGFNEAGCMLPGESEEDEVFSGVRFYVSSEEVDLSCSDFLSLLLSISESYVERNPQDGGRVRELLAAINSSMA